MQHKVVSRDEWIAARKAHLANEKAFTKARDRLSAERRALPWVKVEKNYVFDTPEGKNTLADLFDGRSQLIVYHFMLGPDWGEGCPSCSFLADHFDGAALHLAHRDVTLIAVSRAPLPEIEHSSSAWAGVSNGCRPTATTSTTTSMCRSGQRRKRGEVYYNYEMGDFRADEMPGVSVFYQGRIRRHLPHLLGLRARSRHPGRRLQLPRPRAQGPRRGALPGPWLGCGATTSYEDQPKNSNLAALDAACHRPGHFIGRADF